MLRLLACCAPEQIPLHLLLQPRSELTGSLPAELAAELAALLDDPLAADDAVASLRRFSLVSPPREGLVSVHRLVQAVTLGQLPADQAQSWWQAARSLIEAALPSDADQPGTWAVFATLLPHAEVALPADGGGMARITDFLGYSGNYAAARALQQRKADALQRMLGAEHPDTLAARARLTAWTGAAGDPATARDQFAALLPAMERVLGAEHPDALYIRADLARQTGKAGDPAAARDQFAALLQIHERVSGAEHTSTLFVRANLALWTGAAGDPAGARDQLAALLPVMKRVLGAEHQETLHACAGLARWTGKAGNTAAARDQLAALLPVMERVLGTEHHDAVTARPQCRWLPISGATCQALRSNPADKPRTNDQKA